jgi:peptide/nickel transport system substrate-binding protein
LRPLIANNLAVRKAIMLGIDKKAIVEHIIGAMGDPADSIVLDVSDGYTSVPGFLKFDPEAAKAILDEAGWKMGGDGVRTKDGQRLELVFVTDTTRDYRNREVAQAVQSYLQQIGIAVTLKLLERGPFVDMVIQKGEGYDLAIQGWGSPTNEASWWIYTRLHSSNQGLGAWGTTRNRSPKLDAMIDAARVELDPGAAKQKWAQIQRTIYDEAIMIPLYFANRITAVRKNVKGYKPHPDEWYGYSFVNVEVK